mmetsp:Transcript_42016/g.94066  ORF Transcript_42016/g.94066 Transcript_42016/m.94066 type:complete len:237 (-) Transcript_42016:491-1201(-)
MTVAEGHVLSSAHCVLDLHLLWLLGQHRRQTFFQRVFKSKTSRRQASISLRQERRALVLLLHLGVQLQNCFPKLALSASADRSFKSNPVWLNVAPAHVIPRVQRLLWPLGFLKREDHAPVSQGGGINALLLHELQVCNGSLQLSGSDHGADDRRVGEDIGRVPLRTHLLHRLQRKLPLPRILQSAQGRVQNLQRWLDTIVPELLECAHCLLPLIPLPVEHQLLRVALQLLVPELLV